MVLLDQREIQVHKEIQARKAKQDLKDLQVPIAGIIMEMV